MTDATKLKIIYVTIVFVFIFLGLIFWKDIYIDFISPGYYDCASGQTGDCSYISFQRESEKIPQAVVWQDNTTYYYKGKFGINQIFLQIRKENRENYHLDIWTGEYLYEGISDKTINLEGKETNGILELKEFVYDIDGSKIESKNKITIDSTGKKAIWSSDDLTYTTILQPEIGDEVKIGLLQKFKIVETQFFDLNCILSGKLEVGKCKVVDKNNTEKSTLDVFGFPVLVENNKKNTVLTFEKVAYGVCSMQKIEIDNTSLEAKTIMQKNGCEF
jgi:hypothetical protein